MSTTHSPSTVGTEAETPSGADGWSPWWIVPALVLVTLATRGALAWQLDAVCRDATFYQMLADRMRSGDLDGAMHAVELNLYVALLALWRAVGDALGVGATNASLAWGVLAAGLTIPPLFDWLKRQFGYGVAVGGTATFAVHPAFTETGVEPIRDGTFWLLAVCTLAACFRAADPNRGPNAGNVGNADGASGPVRLRWFLLAGLSATAATLTRTEGWFLFALLFGWSALAAWRRPEERRGLLGGVALALATVPATLLAVNVTLLHDHSQWEWGRLSVLESTARWVWERAAGTSPDSAADVAPAAVAEQATSAAHAAAQADIVAHANQAALATENAAAAEAADPLWLIYAEGLLGSFKPVFLILCGIALVLYWRRVVRMDVWPNWFVSLTVMAAVLQRLMQHGEINGRYFLLPALLSMPLVGLLLDDAARWAAPSLANVRLPPARRWWRTALLGTGMLALALMHVVDAQQSDHPRRVAELRVAASLRARLERSLAVEAATDAGQGARAAQPVRPRVWGVGTAARVAKEMGGDVRTSFSGVSVEEAAAVRPDLIVLPRSSGRSFDFELTGPEWLAAGFRVLPPPADVRSRRRGDDDEVDEQKVWDRMVVLVPEEAALGRTEGAAPSRSRPAPQSRRSPPGISRNSLIEPQTEVRSAASPDAARYAVVPDGPGAPDLSARR